MAKFVYKNAFFSVSGNDLSDHMESLTFNYSATTPEDTSMGDDSINRLAGIKDWSFDVSYRQDFAAGNVDAILWPLVGAAAFAIIFRPDSGAKSASNPEFTGNALLSTYNPISGTHGDTAAAPATFVADGDLGRDV